MQSRCSLRGKSNNVTLVCVVLKLVGVNFGIRESARSAAPMDAIVSALRMYFG